MEDMIENFVKVEPERIYSDGSAVVYSDDFCDGCSDGYGDGMGCGRGGGKGRGDGSGHGGGDGWGCGRSDGSGCGLGFGFGIKTFNNEQIYIIDHVAAIIKSVKDNIAQGFILKEDFTLSPCYIMKNGNIFAFGETLFEAHTAMVNKLLDNDLD